MPDEQIPDIDVFERLSDPVQKWWYDQFNEYIDRNDGLFTPPQKEAIPKLDNGKNTLIASPTGSGKTLSSTIVEIDKLFQKAQNGELENSVYCLYVSPLKSLTNDIKRNLEEPLNGIQEYADVDQEIRHAVRHGDTSSYEKQKMLETTPHILNTTPETLAILLNSPKFKEKLKTVETVIVDEIHSLASNKRGVHLSLSLERLEELAQTDIKRVGCSATVEPIDEIAKYLVGPDRSYDVVDTRYVRNTELEVVTPVDNLIEAEDRVISDNLYQRIHEEIQQSSTTIIFTNTRSGAESTLSRLQNQFEDYTSENTAVHHGSLGKEKRENVEQRLKEGSYDVVTTSTSLELGIDMQDVDLVIQIGSPKSISSLLQRIGRAGHQLGETIRGVIFALDNDDLVECTTMAKAAHDGFIDRIFIPKNCHDVLIQHIYGMAINNIWSEQELFDVIKRSYCYHQYNTTDFQSVLRYMSGGYDGLEDKNIYPKIWWDANDPVGGEHHYESYDVGEQLIGKRGRQARMIYYQNIGTIPDTFSCGVYTRNDEQWVGELDEEYLNTLEKGDVFQLGGSNYEYKYRRNSKIYVDRTTKTPTVPSWYSERLPLSYDLGVKINAFQETIQNKLADGSARQWLSSNFPIDDNTVTALYNLYKQQYKYLGTYGISTTDTFVIERIVEDAQTNYYVQSNHGRKFNDGFARLLAYQITEETNLNVDIAVTDQGFALTVPTEETIDIIDIIESLSSSDVRQKIRSALNGTDIFKRYFRINATRGLMILRNYRGNTKSAKQQQMQSEMMISFADSLDNFVITDETYREIMEDKLNVDKIEQWLKRVQDNEISLIVHNVSTPSPLVYRTASLSATDTVKATDQSKMLEQFHQQVKERLTESPDELTKN